MLNLFLFSDLEVVKSLAMKFDDFKTCTNEDHNVMLTFKNLYDMRSIILISSS